MLTPKALRFVSEYLQDLDATAAARRAGYAARSAKVTACRLLKDPAVQAEVQQRQAAQLERADLSSVRTLEEIGRVAFSNVRNLVDESGKLKPMRALTEDQAAAIASLEVVIKNAAAGDEHTETIHKLKLKLWDKVRALELLMKHFGLIKDVPPGSVEVTLLEKVARARARLQKPCAGPGAGHADPNGSRPGAFHSHEP